MLSCLQQNRDVVNFDASVDSVEMSSMKGSHRMIAHELLYDFSAFDTYPSLKAYQVDSWWTSLQLRPPMPINPPTWNRHCMHCGAFLLSTEDDSFCCRNGNHVVPPLQPLPNRMQALLQIPSQRRHLIEYSRVINNLFSFAGIGVTGGGFQHFPAGGPPAVAITGRTYHLIRNTEYTDHSIHWFLYDEQMLEKKAIQFGAHGSVVQAIKNDIRDVNPYVAQLQYFNSPNVHRPRILELKDYSSPADFAAVMHASNSTAINPQSILIRRRRSQQPEFINILSHHYEPLHYVLFFPHAEIGWGASSIAEVPHMTQHQWYRGRLLADNNDRFSTFGHLCCEYLVDMYSRTEEQKLAYIARERRFREHELHAANESLEDEFEPTIKLPASFVGSHAWTSEQASDAMALGRKYGKPTFFMTMTFNPDWPEVQSRLLPGQTAFDVPIVVARTFKSRLEKVLHLLRTRFGQKKYLIKVIEFQKRGFPHAHILLKVSFNMKHLSHLGIHTYLIS